MQVLVEHGHNKNDILHNYSKEEISVFYDKCVKQDMKHDADFATMVSLGIASSFGGGKKVQNILDQMRNPD